MEKGRILDADGRTREKEMRKSILRSAVLGLGCFVALVILGCSMPRIIVLDDPLTADEHLKLGIAYEAKSEYDAAIKEYEAAAKQLNIANLHIGNIYFEKKDLDRAEVYYRKAMKTPNDPDIADAYNNLAWLYYIKKDRLDDAEFLVTKAIELKPSSADNYKDTLLKIRELKKNYIK